jgi:hypothetical protein
MLKKRSDIELPEFDLVDVVDSAINILMLTQRKSHKKANEIN